MDTVDLWALNPELPSSDTGAVGVRRKLAALIAKGARVAKALLDIRMIEDVVRSQCSAARKELGKRVRDSLPRLRYLHSGTCTSDLAHDRSEKVFCLALARVRRRR